MKIGVIGNGFVGQATRVFADAPGVESVVFDICPAKCDPVNVTVQDIALTCDLIFVCVPTPMAVETGKCDVSIVSSVVEQINRYRENAPVILRSTVPPGTCESLRIAHMPEYLTEANWHHDFVNAEEWHLGINATVHETLALSFQRLLNICYQKRIIHSNLLILQRTQVTEAAKYFRNAMLSTKIALCNEFKRYCDEIEIDYEDVRTLFTKDPRIGPGHTKVPGPDGKHGFGGTCLVKDLSGLIHSMEQTRASPAILQAVKYRNETIDRSEKEWLKDHGRSVQ